MASTAAATERSVVARAYQLNLRLYGLPNRSWELKVPKDRCELFNIPAPTIGINFANQMHNRTWLPTVAFYSDSWLLAVAFYYATKSGFDKADRQRLHDMKNDVPTLYEIVTWEAPQNNQVSSEVTTTEDEEDGSEDEFDQEEEDGGWEDESDQEESDEM